MPSFDQSFETVVLPPPSQLTHSFHHESFNAPQIISDFSKAPVLGKTPPMLPWAHKTKIQTQHTTTTTTTTENRSRKRSRDDAAANLNDDDYSLASSPVLTPEVEEEWQYGEGMTLIKPNGNGCIIDASSSTGTWAEEKAAEEEAERLRLQAQIQANRPIVRNKLQRLDYSATPVIVEETTPSIASSPPKSEPTVDDFTIHLGIGWNRVSEDEHIQAAARGWAKFIENNYPVTAPTIQLESRGLSSYLVEAKEGFFLFGEDLKQGRLVSTDFVKAVQNLQVNPPIFDGSEVLVAMSETQAKERTQQHSINSKTTDANVQYHEVSNSIDIEMDMN